MPPSLKQTTARGLFWGLVNNGTQQVLNLVFGIFLARLLTPADYGMVGMLSVFSFIAAAIQESGFISALANRKVVEHRDFNAVFWFSTLLSFSLYWILFFCAPLIARFYHNPDLIPLARYSFIGFFISGLGIVPTAYLFRNMQVKQKAVGTILALVVSGITGITLAYHGFSYWGIATQSLVYISVLTLFLWCVCPWRPTFSFDFRPLREMLAFGFKLLFTNIFNHVNNNLFAIILGRFYSEREVGQFNQANKWNYMGHSLISGMVGSVAQPLFAQIADDNERQLRVFRKMLRFTSFISFPAMLGLSLVAPELITIAITEKWLPSARILQLLAISGAFLPIITLYSNLLISKGRSDIYLGCTVALGILQLATMLVTYPYGLTVMVSLFVIIQILWLFVWHHFVRREIKLSYFAALKDITPFALIATFAMTLSYFFTYNIENIYLLFGAKILIAATVYTLILWASKAVTFRECLSYLLKKRKAD